MPSEIKEKLVTDLIEELKISKHVLVTEYQGMTAGEFDELRAVLRPLGSKYKVVKNRLAKIAFEKAGHADLKIFMKGPSAIAYQGNDGASLAKILFKFSEQHTNLKVRAGRIENVTTDAKGLKTISNLPSREVLIAILLSRMQGPLQTLMATLNAPLSSLHRALGVLAKKKESTAA